MRGVLAAGLLASCAGLIGTVSAHAQYGGLLSDPGAYNFAPPADRASGVASVGFGSRDMSQTAIRLDSGPIGTIGAQAFVSLGSQTGPDFHWDASKIRLHGQAVTAGIEEHLPGGITLSVLGAWDHLSQSHGAAAGGFP